MPPVTRSQARLHGSLKAAELAASAAEAAPPSLDSASAVSGPSTPASSVPGAAAGAANAAAAAAAAAADNARRQRIASGFTTLITQWGTLRMMLSNMTEEDFLNLSHMGITLFTRENANGLVSANEPLAVWNYLGAHCDEGHYRREIRMNWRCPSDEFYIGVMKWCTRGPSTEHRVNFNVCDTCRERAQVKLDRLVNRSHTVKGHIQTHCKYHAKYIRKHWNDIFQYKPCLCIVLAQDEWRCRSCSVTFLKKVVIDWGSSVRHELKRTHRVKVRRGNTVKLVRKLGRKRKKPGCPYRVSERPTTRCARPQWDTRAAQQNVTYQCLNCDGFMLEVDWHWNDREYYDDDQVVPTGRQFSSDEEEPKSSDDENGGNGQGGQNNQDADPHGPDDEDRGNGQGGQNNQVDHSGSSDDEDGGNGQGGQNSQVDYSGSSDDEDGGNGQGDEDEEDQEDQEEEEEEEEEE